MIDGMASLPAEQVNLVVPGILGRISPQSKRDSPETVLTDRKRKEILGCDALPLRIFPCGTSTTVWFDARVASKRPQLRAAPTLGAFQNRSIRLTRAPCI